MSATDHATVATAALVAAMSADVSSFAELFTDDVVGWSPNLFVESRAELEALLGEREDAFTDVAVTVDAADVIGDKAILEWRASAVFSGPFLLDDDVLVEPTGGPMVLAGVLVAEFRGDKINAFRAYFDDAAFLEQLLAPA